MCFWDGVLSVFLVSRCILLEKILSAAKFMSDKIIRKNDAGLDCTVWFGDTEAEVNTDRPKKLGCCSVWPQWL